MQTYEMFKNLTWYTGALALLLIFILFGCATQDYVGKQINPLSDRVQQTENRIGQTEGQIGKLGERVTANEGKISSVEGNLVKVDAKAEQALATLGNLKFERRLSLAIDMKEGANFDFNSATLPDGAKQKLDEFLNELNRDLAMGENAVFLVAGHTDNAGSDDINYDLGERRANTVSRYLITQKKVDPLRVVTVSYGESAPITENDTRDGRAKNRRVEILVYREAINSNLAAATRK